MYQHDLEQEIPPLQSAHGACKLRCRDTHVAFHTCLLSYLVGTPVFSWVHRFMFNAKFGSTLTESEQLHLRGLRNWLYRLRSVETKRRFISEFRAILDYVGNYIQNPALRSRIESHLRLAWLKSHQWAMAMGDCGIGHLGCFTTNSNESFHSVLKRVGDLKLSSTISDVLLTALGIESRRQQERDKQRR